MKSIRITTLLLLALLLGNMPLLAGGELHPYLLAGQKSGTMEEAAAAVREALSTGGFTVIGEYSPAGNKDLHVIAYTRNDLQQTVLQVEDRGALASILKVGLKKAEGTVTVSMLNPMYLFYAYLREDTDRHLASLQKVTADAQEALKPLGGDFSGFGGSEKAEDLKDYHYMAFMPYFDDPVELRSFSSFQAGLDILRKNLKAGKGETRKVYELVFEQEEIAVFGIGLLGGEKGEGRFLPIIGEENIAAMPYEIILTGTEATMLHGKYRFALHWPELSMSQFMKISSTPGDVEDVLEALTE